MSKNSSAASWIEVSDAYVKLEFKCKKCGRRHKKSVADLMKKADAAAGSILLPVCGSCKIEMSNYIGTHVYQ